MNRSFWSDPSPLYTPWHASVLVWAGKTQPCLLCWKLSRALPSMTAQSLLPQVLLSASATSHSSKFPVLTPYQIKKHFFWFILRGPLGLVV